MSTFSNRIAVVSVAVIAAMSAVWIPKVARGEEPAMRHASERDLERRLELLEKHNHMLEQQNQAIQGQLSAQKAEIQALKQQMENTAQPVRNLQQEMPQVKRQVAEVARQQKEPPFSVGFVTGWADSPYDMPGGFFYGAYLRDRLLTEEDGVPAGSISGELLAGVVMGNHAVSSGNLASALGVVGPVSSFMDTIEIEPTAQYHLDLDAVGLKPLDAIKPYVLAGPGMWITLMSTPVVNKSGPGARFRHADADFQPGGVYGAGFQLSLGKLQVPAIQGILNKTSVGAEWRYNELANGENFQQYTGVINLGF
jgi:hypothetical protein